MRAALDSWLDSVVDWSDISETAMTEEFYPTGKRPQTPAPTVSIADGKLIAEGAIDGSSLGYRVDGNHWFLYSGPTDVSTSDTVEVKAVRYGWTESDVIALERR
jgi:N-sulfoglucosamine sulfohydrolase